MLLFFIQSIKTKSYFSFKVGIISKAFHKKGFIKNETHAFSKLFKASLCEFGENSIVVIVQFHNFFNSNAKLIVEKPLAVPISKIFLVFFILTKSLRNLAFVKLIFGISFLIQYSFNSLKNLSSCMC